MRNRTALTVGAAAIAVPVAVAVAVAVPPRTGPHTPPAAPTASRAASPSPAPTPAPYGATGLAGQYARALGHDSLSGACAAGREWTCGVHRVEVSAEFVGLGQTSTRRDVFTTSAPLDGDAVAREWLNASPPSVTGINLKDTTGLSAVTVGTATRGAGE